MSTNLAEFEKTIWGAADHLKDIRPKAEHRSDNPILVRPLKGDSKHAR